MKGTNVYDAFAQTVANDASVTDLATHPINVAISKGDAIQIEISDDLARVLVTPPLSWWQRLKRKLGFRFPHRASLWMRFRPIGRDDFGVYYEKDN